MEYAKLNDQDVLAICDLYHNKGENRLTNKDIAEQYGRSASLVGRCLKKEEFLRSQIQNNSQESLDVAVEAAQLVSGETATATYEAQTMSKVPRFSRLKALKNNISPYLPSFHQVKRVAAGVAAGVTVMTLAAYALISDSDKKDTEKAEKQGFTSNESYDEVLKIAGKQDLHKEIQNLAGKQQLHSEIQDLAGKQQLHSEIQSIAGNQQNYQETQAISGKGSTHSEVLSILNGTYKEPVAPAFVRESPTQTAARAKENKAQIHNLEDSVAKTKHHLSKTDIYRRNLFETAARANGLDPENMEAFKGATPLNRDEYLANLKTHRDYLAKWNKFHDNTSEIKKGLRSLGAKFKIPGNRKTHGVHLAVEGNRKVMSLYNDYINKLEQGITSGEIKDARSAVKALDDLYNGREHLYGGFSSNEERKLLQPIFNIMGVDIVNMQVIRNEAPMSRWDKIVVDKPYINPFTSVRSDEPEGSKGYVHTPLELLGNVPVVGVVARDLVGGTNMQKALNNPWGRAVKAPWGPATALKRSGRTARIAAEHYIIAKKLIKSKRSSKSTKTSKSSKTTNTSSSSSSSSGGVGSGGGAGAGAGGLN